MMPVFRLEYWSPVNHRWHPAGLFTSYNDAVDERDEIEESDPDEWDGTRWRVAELGAEDCPVYHPL